MLTVMSLNLGRGAKGDRWAHLAEIIGQVQPQILLLQEADSWDQQDQLAHAQRDLGMRGRLAATTTGHPTGIFIDEAVVGWGNWTTNYSHKTFHGHAELSVHVPELAEPIQVISAHLNPSSAYAARDEAQLLVSRTYRYGNYGILGGDINHIPPGDRPPNWHEVSPQDCTARAVVVNGELRPNHAVGEALALGDLVDVAAHLADVRDDPSLRSWTGHAGQVRTDQFHITRSLLPALCDYRRVSTTPWTDHDAIVAVLDLSE